MTKVHLIGLLPPEHPIYKEGWSVATQPKNAAAPPAPKKPAKKKK